MSTYTATVEWARGGQDFLAGRYSREHTIRFDGGVTLAGSASPSVVPAPLSTETAVDPEELFVAALSACHMLWFLDFARRSGADVERYLDTATGEMSKDEQGRFHISRVVLRPEVRFADPFVPRRLGEALHRQAHAACFIANSVRTEVLVEPVETAEEERQDG